MAFSKFIQTARSVVEDAAKVTIIARYPANLLDSKVVGHPHATFELPLLAPLSDEKRAAYQHELDLLANEVGYMTYPVKVFQPMGTYPGSMVVKVISPIPIDYLTQR